jgi:5'-3' exonuclease
MTRIPFGCVDNGPILQTNGFVESIPSFVEPDGHGGFARRAYKPGFADFSVRLDKRFAWRIDRAVNRLMYSYFNKESSGEMARLKAYHFAENNIAPAIKHLACLSDDDLSVVRGVGPKTIEYIRSLVYYI